MADVSYELYQDKKKEWRWRGTYRGKIVAASTEGYVARRGCLNNLGLVLGNSLRMFTNVTEKEEQYLSKKHGFTWTHDD